MSRRILRGGLGAKPPVKASGADAGSGSLPLVAPLALPGGNGPHRPLKALSGVAP